MVYVLVLDVNVTRIGRRARAAEEIASSMSLATTRDARSAAALRRALSIFGSEIMIRTPMIVMTARISISVNPAWVRFSPRLTLMAPSLSRNKTIHVVTTLNNCTSYGYLQ